MANTFKITIETYEGGVRWERVLPTGATEAEKEAMIALALKLVPDALHQVLGVPTINELLGMVIEDPSKEDWARSVVARRDAFARGEAPAA